jgi:hypothetical protein
LLQAQKDISSYKAKMQTTNDLMVLRSKINPQKIWKQAKADLQTVCKREAKIRNSELMKEKNDLQRRR